MLVENKSGALHILNESLVLVAGSTNGFIEGKNYNRCKRIHELLSLAFEILHSTFYLITKATRMKVCLGCMEKQLSFG